MYLVKIDENNRNEIDIVFDDQRDVERLKGALRLAADIGYDFPVIGTVIKGLECLNVEKDSDV